MKAELNFTEQERIDLLNKNGWSKDTVRRLIRDLESQQREIELLKEKYNANFLYGFPDDSIESIGYEFANAKTEGYQKECWEVLKQAIAQSELSRIREGVEWRNSGSDIELFVRGKKVATVYPNGYWWVWDTDGVGMQNSKEESQYEAQVQAGGRAIIDGCLTKALTLSDDTLINEKGE